MGFASLAAGLVVKMVRNGYKATRSSSLGVPRPHVWEFKQRALYRGIKTMNHPGIKAIQVKGSYDMGEAIRELPSQHGVSAWWLEKALRYVHQESGVRTIMMYLKSAGAGDLSKAERARLYAACLSKLRHLEMMKDFM